VRRLDIFPAVVKVSSLDSLSDVTDLNFKSRGPEGTRRLDACRVVVLGDIVYVVVDSSEGPRVVFKEGVKAWSRVGGVAYVHTTSSKLLAVIKDRDCGCGSRLKGWSPL
jgi:hypothetical protein